MPYVNIKITKEGPITAAQKLRLIDGSTRLLRNVLNKPAQSTYVVIDEIDTDNWGVGDESVTQLRARQRAESEA